MKRFSAFLLCLLLLAGCAASPAQPTDEKNHFSYDKKEDRYLYEGTYDGDFSLQRIELDFEKPDLCPHICKVMELAEYAALCKEWGFGQDYTAEGTYLVVADSAWGIPLTVDLGGVTYDSDTKIACLYVYEQAFGCTADFPAWLIAVPTKWDAEAVTFETLTTKDDLARHREEEENPVAYKPILYLYPETEIALTVTLGKPEKLTCTYPTYKDGWRVTASPDGTLRDEKGRSYYALYWEGGYAPKLGEEGFCVTREDLIPFLEDSLAALGLNEREAEEFIVYWLPTLQESPYVCIRFAGTEEMNEVMPLDFSVQPDTLIRVLMEYAPLSEPIRLTPQILNAPERRGFVAVEWGGAKMP